MAHLKITNFYITQYRGEVKKKGLIKDNTNNGEFIYEKRIIINNKFKKMQYLKKINKNKLRFTRFLLNLGYFI